MSRAEAQLREKMTAMGFVSGNELYIPASAADDFLEACRAVSLAVVGIEVFSKEDHRMRPHLDLIADFSSLTDGQAAWPRIVSATIAEARDFIVGIPQSHSRWLNFTLLSAREAKR